MTSIIPNLYEALRISKYADRLADKKANKLFEAKSKEFEQKEEELEEFKTELIQNRERELKKATKYARHLGIKSVFPYTVETKKKDDPLFGHIYAIRTQAGVADVLNQLELNKLHFKDFTQMGTLAFDEATISKRFKKDRTFKGKKSTGSKIEIIVSDTRKKEKIPTYVAFKKSVLFGESE